MRASLSRKEMIKEQMPSKTGFPSVHENKMNTYS